MFSEFKSHVLSDTLDSEQLFQKFFVDSSSYFFEHIYKNIDSEYELKKDVAEVLRVHINDIYIVGSAKTGFSMKPKAYGRLFDQEYKITSMKKDMSDLDVAIVSPKLFDMIQEAAYDLTCGYRRDWDKNIYYSDGKSKFGVSLKYKFLEYLGKGWYRPDFAPKQYKIETATGDLNAIVNKWRARLKRKVSYAVYKNWHFFKKYQLENIESIKEKITSGDLL